MAVARELIDKEFIYDILANTWHNVKLIGIKDSNNRIFKTEYKFKEKKILVFWKSGIMEEGSDFTTFESIPGEGFDSVKLIVAPAPRDDLHAQIIRDFPFN